MTLIHVCENCIYCLECHKTSCTTSEPAIKESIEDGWITKRCPFCDAVMEKFETLERLREKKDLNCYQKLDEVMQCGLQFRFFNKPVRITCEDGTRLWDIQIFWEHVDVTVSEGFESPEACIDDCLKYVRNYNN